MVQALVKIDENTNRILNIVKAQYNLKDKGEAIQIVVKEYEEEILEPKLRPEFIERLKKIRKGKYLSRKEFEKEVGKIV